MSHLLAVQFFSSIATVWTPDCDPALPAGHRTIGSRAQGCDEMVLEQQIPGVMSTCDMLLAKVTYLFVCETEASLTVVRMQCIR